MDKNVGTPTVTIANWTPWREVNINYTELWGKIMFIISLLHESVTEPFLCPSMDK